MWQYSKHLSVAGIAYLPSLNKQCYQLTLLMNKVYFQNQIVLNYENYLNIRDELKSADNIAYKGCLLEN